MLPVSIIIELTKAGFNIDVLNKVKSSKVSRVNKSICKECFDKKNNGNRASTENIWTKERSIHMNDFTNTSMCSPPESTASRTFTAW